jgi:HK97 family phage major capsid protein
MTARKENKMAAPRPGVEALLRAFESFKDANDQRLAAIEAGRADVLLEEKVDRIESSLQEHKAALDRMALAGRRPQRTASDPVPEDRTLAWGAYLRKGDASGLERLELKALSVGSDADGGYVAPPELDQMIERRLAEVSPMRQIASVRVTGANVFKKTISTTAAATGWAAETGARATGATPTLAQINFPTAELFANLAATQTLLDDAYVNIEEWIASEVEEAFAAQERLAFVSGDGVNKPKGFLAYENVAEGSHVWGKIGYIATGVSAAFPVDDPADKVIDLIYTPRAQFRQNGRFVMNRKTLATVRKLKDSNDAYIWRASETDGAASIFGHPVTEIEDMPDVAANSFSIAFGDFQRAYLIVDRAGVRVLRDPYTAKPYVLFYVTKRVAGGVQNFDALKLMKFGAS